MSALKFRRYPVIAFAVLALGASGFAGYQTATQEQGANVQTFSEHDIELQKHKKRQRRCKPKSKYGKPKPPRKCRRRPHR